LKKNEGGPNHENRPQGSKIYEVEEEGFTLICIAGIKDIIRREVPDAVKMCNIFEGCTTKKSVTA
jgi:magnesium-transporting ATPase (P-type)